MVRPRLTPVQEQIKAVRRGAMAGDPACLCRMGDLHIEGKYVPEDRKRALRYYRRAADAGLTEALTKTASLLLDTATPGSDMLGTFTLAAGYAAQALVKGDPAAGPVLAGILKDVKTIDIQADFAAGADGTEVVSAALVRQISLLLENNKALKQAAPSADI